MYTTGDTSNISHTTVSEMWSSDTEKLPFKLKASRTVCTCWTQWITSIWQSAPTTHTLRLADKLLNKQPIKFTQKKASTNTHHIVISFLAYFQLFVHV